MIEPGMYQAYKSLRAMGLRACLAFGIAKYGIQFLIDYMIEEEMIGE